MQSFGDVSAAAAKDCAAIGNSASVLGGKIATATLKGVRCTLKLLRGPSTLGLKLLRLLPCISLDEQLL